MSSPDEPRRHAAWRVAAVVLGLVVLAGIAVGVLSIAGDDGDAEPAAPSASAPSEVPDIGGLVVEGTGYTVQVPEGWTDGTDDFVATNPGLSTLDRVLVWATPSPPPGAT